MTKYELEVENKYLRKELKKYKIAINLMSGLMAIIALLQWFMGS